MSLTAVEDKQTKRWRDSLRERGKNTKSPMEGDCGGEEPLSTPAEANRGRAGRGRNGKVMGGDKIGRPAIRHFPGEGGDI